MIKILNPCKATFTGIGQVMFQQSAWTGLLFLAGIFWGSYENHIPQVAYGAIVGAVVATLSGYLLQPKSTDFDAGLFGFNGTLVGCAFPTFLANTWLMWLALVICAAMTSWVRTGFNNVMAPWKCNSLTFPFVFMTWIFLYASRMMHGLPTDPSGLSMPQLNIHFDFVLDTSFGQLVIYWLKGISQVFLINSWVTGIFFLVALAVCSRWACMWAAIASAVSLAIAILFEADPNDIANGLFGFSPVLTGIAVGCTFYKPGLKTALWTLMAIIATVFVQAGMDSFFTPYGLPTLTGPFCITTWLFLLPAYKLNTVQS
ncbi:MAG: urea transporter [Muribaculaceae bacterium]|nr:urea transporter [Muribaculaceae bacterium]